MTQIVKRPETLPEIRPPELRRLEPVRTQTVTFEGPGETLHLESGQTLHPVTVAYETYGQLNDARDNAVLVCHALSGDAHAAGYYGLEKDEKPGWWDVLIGPGKPLDTDKYFVISSNFLGGCKGTTGPMVQVQRRLLKHLGVPRLLAVIGGSLGGMQVLQWAISFPEMVRGAIPIATTARLSPQAIAFNEVARQAVMSDPDWREGDYPLDAQPERGLGLARMIGHITYLSEQSMLRKFSRRFINGQGRSFCLTKDFQVESYLHHQGSSFVRRFDANTYLYITRAMDYFDLEAAYGRLSTAFSGCRCPFLAVSFTSDWLFPPEQSRELVQALRRVGLDVSYCNIESDQGHDAFLLPGHRMGDVVAGFLDRLTRMAAS